MQLKNSWLSILFILAFTTPQFIFAHDKDSTSSSLKIKPTADFDQRFYYTQSQHLNVWGYRGGIMINDKFKTGLGGYYMVDNSLIASQSAIAVDNFFSVGFHLLQRQFIGTAYFEPFIFRKKYIETSAVFEAGYGKIYNTFLTSDFDVEIKKQTGFFIPAGAGLSLNLKMPTILKFKPTRWFGVNLIGGYRISVYQNVHGLDYNGWYWSLSGAVFLDRFADDLHAYMKKHHRKKEL